MPENAATLDYIWVKGKTPADQPQESVDEDPIGRLIERTNEDEDG